MNIFEKRIQIAKNEVLINQLKLKIYNYLQGLGEVSDLNCKTIPDYHISINPGQGFNKKDMSYINPKMTKIAKLQNENYELEKK